MLLGQDQVFSVKKTTCPLKNHRPCGGGWSPAPLGGTPETTHAWTTPSKGRTENITKVQPKEQAKCCSVKRGGPLNAHSGVCPCAISPSAKLWHTARPRRSSLAAKAATCRNASGSCGSPASRYGRGRGGGSGTSGNVLRPDDAALDEAAQDEDEAGSPRLVGVCTSCGMEGGMEDRGVGRFP